MEKRKVKKQRKVGKVIVIISSVFVMLCALSLAVLTTLDLTGIASFSTDTTRFYTITFYVGGNKFDERKYEKGSVVTDTSFMTPVKASQFPGYYYQFTGWDLNKDGMEDYFGFRIYSNYNADAIFRLLPKGAK